MLSMSHGGNIKCVDFGFAKILKTGKTLTKCGTVVYIAPEILVGNGHDHRVDIWSLGVLICEIMSGKTPFEAPSTMQVYEKIINGMPTFNRFVTSVVRCLLERVFRTDVDNRLTLDDIKRHEFFADINFEALAQGQKQAPWIPTHEVCEQQCGRDSQTGALKTKKVNYEKNS